MEVELHYGKGLISLQIPQANIEQIIWPWQQETKADNITLVRQALTGKEMDNFQGKIAGKRLCVLVDDGTREEPFEDIFGQLFGVFRSRKTEVGRQKSEDRPSDLCPLSSVISSPVQFLICTGTHEPDTTENNRIVEQIIKAAKQVNLENFAIHVHDCEHDKLIKAGRTSRGTEIMFNALADDADVFLVVSDAKVHYFAGYSNPVKNFVPGICAYQTAEQNHRLALDEKSTFGIHPWHSDENRKNNPLAEDQLEGMRLLVKERPVYALVTITASGQIQWARFGPAEKVSGEAFSEIDKRNTHTVKPVSRLIISPGGLPNDISLYIAQRALELTKNAASDGGEILFLAACPDGIGEKKTIENFYDRLTAPLDKILKSIAGEYKLYSHKPYKFAQMIQRLRRIWMYCEIPDNIIEAAHLYPAHQPQTIVDNWLTEQPDVKITVVDGANKIALYAKT